jgi:hypothetical protein
MDSGIATLQDYVSLVADSHSNVETAVKEQSL